MTDLFPNVPPDVTDAFGDYLAVIAQTIGELCSPEPSLEPDLETVKRRIRELNQRTASLQAAHGTPLTDSAADLLNRFQSVFEELLDVVATSN